MSSPFFSGLPAYARAIGSRSGRLRTGTSIEMGSGTTLEPAGELDRFAAGLEAPRQQQAHPPHGSPFEGVQQPAAGPAPVDGSGHVEADGRPLEARPRLKHRGLGAGVEDRPGPVTPKRSRRRTAHRNRLREVRRQNRAPEVPRHPVVAGAGRDAHAQLPEHACQLAVGTAPARGRTGRDQQHVDGLSRPGLPTGSAMLFLTPKPPHTPPWSPPECSKHR